MSELLVNVISNAGNDGPPDFPFGATGIATATNAAVAAYADVAGIATYATTAGIATDAQGLTGTPDITVGNIVAAGGTFSGDLQVQGTVTYEDVTSVDSVGVITARQGIRVGAGQSIGSTGSAEDVVYYGDGSNLTGLNIPSGSGSVVNDLDVALFN